MAHAEWWQSFFPDLYVQVQRDPVAHRAAEREAAFIWQALRVKPPSRLLDVPCGAGRHAVELASLGYEVCGVDITAAALEEARLVAARRGVGIEWHERDMRDLPWRESFDGAYCYFGSFGYFDDEGNQRFLEAVHATLRPGARFVLETHVAELILPRFLNQGWERVGGLTLMEHRRYDETSGRVETDWTMIGDGRPVQGHSSIRLYSYVELCQRLEQAGFSGTEAYDSVTGLPIQPRTTRLAMVAQKSA